MSQIAYDFEKEIYFPGQIVKGIVNLIIDKPIKARAVHLDIIGFEETKVVVGSGKYKHAYLEKNYILKEKVYLYPPEMGGEHELGPGNYPHKIEFKIPNSAPPSYEGEYVKIKYWLETKVDVILRRDIEKTMPFYVYTNRKDLESFAHPASFQSENYVNLDDDKPGFNVELSTLVFKAGKSVKGTIALCNMRACKIRKIKLRLIGIERLRAKGHMGDIDVRSFETELSSDEFIEEKPLEFNIPIPKRTPVSYIGTNSVLGYFLEAQLDLPLKFDVKARYPVEIVR